MHTVEKIYLLILLVLVIVAGATSNVWLFATATALAIFKQLGRIVNAIGRLHENTRRS